MIEGRSHLHMSVYTLLAQYRYCRPGTASNHRRSRILTWIECEAGTHSGLPPITEPIQFLIGAFRIISQALDCMGGFRPEFLQVRQRLVKDQLTLAGQP